MEQGHSGQGSRTPSPVASGMTQTKHGPTIATKDSEWHNHDAFDRKLPPSKTTTTPSHL